MAVKFDKERNCVSLIWKIQNADYRWKKHNGSLISPTFSVDEIESTKWRLEIEDVNSSIYLRRLDAGPESVDVYWEFACLSCDGAVLFSNEARNEVWRKQQYVYLVRLADCILLFRAWKSGFLTDYTFTVRCRLWRSVGEIPQNRQISARTRIPVERGLFDWYVDRFDRLTSQDKKMYTIKSPDSGEKLFHLELFMIGEKIRLKISVICEKIKEATLQLSIADAEGYLVKCFYCEINESRSNEITSNYTKREIMEKKDRYLIGDKLPLIGEYSFPFGTVTEEIEDGSSNIPTIVNVSQEIRCSGQTNDLPVSKDILNNDLKSLLKDNILSDVKLKTRGKSFAAHKCILAVRSPVFKAMFSNDMRENIKDCVDIDDFSDETVARMLRYIYSADVGELEWNGATELYEAADKYEILNLKDICSSFIKTNLDGNNACEALVLSDLHQDEDLKLFVQEFILRHGEEIINSEEWNKLMETHVKLAAETMRRKFKVLAN